MNDTRTSAGPIEGTILVPVGNPVRNGHYARAAWDRSIAVRVGWDGQVEYACQGEEPDRVWWFAGSGVHREGQRDV